MHCIVHYTVAFRGKVEPMEMLYYDALCNALCDALHVKVEPMEMLYYISPICLIWMVPFVLMGELPVALRHAVMHMHTHMHMHMHYVMHYIFHSEVHYVVHDVMHMCCTM